jgi:DNA-cytosine methyltransferase
MSLFASDAPEAPPTFVSLFAGVGGFDLGLERAGLTCVGQVEKHDFCLDVLAKHWPEVPRHNDVVSAVDWWESQDRPKVDLVCGGFPCQDISIAQKNRTGLDGQRSGLYWHALGFVVAVRPRVLLLENVAGLLSSNGGRDLALIQATLAECGYPYLEWRVLDSQYFGVAQRRRRVFLVASASDPRLGPLLLEPEGSGRSLEAKRRTPRSSASSPRGGANARCGGEVEGGPEADADRVREVARLPRGVDDLGQAASPQEDEAQSLTVSTLQGQPGARGYRLDAEAAAGGQLIVLPQHYQKVVRSGERDKNGDLPAEVWAQRDVSATLNMYDVGNTRAVDIVIEQHPQPEGGCGCCPVDPKPDSNRLGTMGNAVTVPVIKWVGDRMYDELMLQKALEADLIESEAS